MMKHLDHEYYYYLPDADTILHRRCKESVHAIYGSVLPTAVEQRLTTELKAIERCGDRRGGTTSGASRYDEGNDQFLVRCLVVRYQPSESTFCPLPV